MEEAAAPVAVASWLVREALAEDSEAWIEETASLAWLRAEEAAELALEAMELAPEARELAPELAPEAAELARDSAADETELTAEPAADVAELKAEDAPPVRPVTPLTMLERSWAETAPAERVRAKMVEKRILIDVVVCGSGY